MMRPAAAVVIAVFGLGCLFGGAGCSGSSGFNYAGLKNIARLGAEQARMGAYVKRQARGFALLKADVARGALQPGVSMKRVKRLYGEPAGEAADGALVYRHPSDGLSLPIVYLRFDAQGALVSFTVLE